MKIPDPPTAFRIPKAILATVDTICAREDLTRSQVFRRSVMEYLKSQNASLRTSTHLNRKENGSQSGMRVGTESHQVNKEKKPWD